MITCTNVYVIACRGTITSGSGRNNAEYVAERSFKDIQFCIWCVNLPYTLILGKELVHLPVRKVW